MAETDKIKLIALDVDGTLITPRNWEVTPRTREVIQEIQQRGILITLISGRVLSSVCRFAREAGISMEVVALNGGVIGRGVKDLLSVKLLLPQEVKELLDIGKTEGLKGAVFTASGIFLKKEEMELKSALRPFGHDEDFYGVDEFPKFENEILPVQVHFIGEEEAIIKCSEKIAMQWKGCFSFFTYSSSRGKYWHLEIRNGIYNKGIALREIASLHGIDMSEVMAIGDWLNDIDMFKCAAIGVAMKNSSNTVKQSASMVTDLTSDEEGVADFLEKTFLS